jgi:hypothetical protein
LKSPEIIALGYLAEPAAARTKGYQACLPELELENLVSLDITLAAGG